MGWEWCVTLFIVKDFQGWGVLRNVLSGEGIRRHIEAKPGPASGHDMMEDKVLRRGALDRH